MKQRKAWPKKEVPEMLKSGMGYLYEAGVDDFVLEEGEEKIMRAMRKLDKLWSQYGGRLILFGGSTALSIRVDRPSADHEIETFPSIKTDGGDGGDNF
jgi:hypothetical protein